MARGIPVSWHSFGGWFIGHTVVSQIVPPPISQRISEQIQPDFPHC
jgi:hypothetical protein